MGNFIGQKLRQHLEALTKSPDSVFEFLQDLPGLFEAPDNTPPPLEPSSLLGLFVRKIHLAFSKASFSTLSRLYSDLCLYVETSSSMDEDDDEEEEEDEASKKKKKNIQSNDPLSPYEYERLIQTEITRIEQSIGKVSQEELQAQIDQLLEVAPNFAKTHYLSYLNCMYHRDYDGAIDNLHRYFDFSIYDNDNAPPDPASSLNDNDAPSPLPRLLPCKSMLPYAVLSLASTHYRFGHMGQAMQAIQETMRVAQELGDSECLAYALTWLCRLMEREANDKVDGETGIEHTLYQGQRELLERAVINSKELQLPSLHALNVLSLAKYELAHPQKTPSLPGGLSSATANMCTFPSKVISMINQAISEGESNSLEDVMGDAYLLKMGAWEHFGNKQLSLLAAQMHIAFFGEKSEPNDACGAYCNIASIYAAQGDLQRALTIILYARKKYPLSGVQNIINRTTAQILHEWSLRRGEYAICDVLGTYMHANAASEETFEAAANATFRSAQLSFYQGRPGEAADTLYELNTTCKKKELMGLSVECSLLQAEIYLNADSPATALPYVLAALAASENYRLDNLHAAATVMLGNLHLAMGFPQKAVEVLEGVMPHILQHCPLALHAESLLLRAKCALADEKTSGFAEVLSLLDKALVIFEQLEWADKKAEIFYIQARIYHDLKKEKERDEAAAKWEKVLMTKEEARRNMSSLNSAMEQHPLW